MANTKRRTNISLDTKLFKEATAYGKEAGISLSALIEQGLRARLKGPTEEANLAPSPPDVEAKIRDILPGFFEEYLRSPDGTRLLKGALSETAGAALARPAPRPTSTPKPSTRAPTGSRPPTVDIPPDILERLRRFSGPQLARATGMDRSSIALIRAGSRTRVQEGTYEKLLTGLDTCEALEKS